MDTSLTPASPHALALIADTEASLREGLVPAAIYNDAELHRLELERIFARAWVFIGHESEIPSPGDYRLRYIGEDPFIFIRDESGKVRCLFDACTHRGAQICRAEKGNASHFRCPYHGWTFQNDGRLVGLPAAKMAYEGMDRECFNLHQAPRVESRHGLVFASLEPNGPSLEEYLGDFAWYFDLHFALGTPRVVGEPHRWHMDVNWKIGGENFSGDDYHTLTLHKSMWDLGIIPVPAAANMMGKHIQAGGEFASHSMSFSIDPNEDGPPPHWWGLTDEQAALLDRSRVTPEHLRVARRARVTVGTMFPNLSLILLALSRDPKRKPPSIMFGVRQWQPSGPNGMELWSWVFAWEEMPADYQREMYLNHASTFGTSGIFEQDDTEPWSSMTRTGGSTFARKQKLRLNYKMGHAGVGSSEVITDFAGPGTVWSNRYEEGVMRNLVWNWIKWMTDGAPDPGSNGRRDLRDLNLELLAEREARAASRNGGAG
ncbi:MAG: Rieske 2Fe-2S domain-containing protein [Actinobacteria bacterium]|nr:Rieske 2Fe-2S domain-containing protein [Actinomycetota bacterium]